MNFDYLYGEQSESYAFYRTPKVFFMDERFRGLSSDAKILYGILLDRVEMSRRNGWIDKENRAYIYFKLEEAIEYLNFGKDKCVKLFAELDEASGIGLIRRKKQGLGKPIMIYVMNFNCNFDDVKTSESVKEDNNCSISANEKECSNTADLKGADIKTSENPNSRLRKNRNQDFRKGEVQTSENPKGFSRPLSMQDLWLLIRAVQSADWMSTRRKRYLITKLLDLTSKGIADN